VKIDDIQELYPRIDESGLFNSRPVKEIETRGRVNVRSVLFSSITVPD